MTEHTYTLNIPNSANNPSFDQPSMEVNNNSAAAIWLDDHYGFEDVNGGLHQQSTYPTTITPGASSSLSSVAYTTPGMALNTIPQYVYQNSQGTFLLSGIRAFGVFNVTSSSVITLNNGYNILSQSIVASGSNDVITVNLKPTTINASGANQATVLVSTDKIQAYTVASISQTGVVTITIAPSAIGGPTFNYPLRINFTVLQA